MPLLVLSLTGSAAKARARGRGAHRRVPLTSLPVGVLADRVDRRRLMLVCALGRMVAIGSVPIALSVGRRRLGLTPDRLRSRVQASATFPGSSVSWIGPLAIGLLVQYADEKTAVLTLAAWTLTIAVSATLAPGLRAVPDLPSLDQ